MLELGEDWKFPIDPVGSTIWMTPQGTWGLTIRCKPTQVSLEGGLEETFAPRLVIDDLAFLGSHWHELVGHEINQHGAWHGDGDPEGSLFVEQRGDLHETLLRITAHSGATLHVSLEGTCDVFLDDDHDTEVALRVDDDIPFEGVKFRFRAEGMDSRDPTRRAVELLSQYLDPEGFRPPVIEPGGEPGLFSAVFEPATDEEATVSQSIDMTLSPEEQVLHGSAKELLEGMVRQGWLELEDDGLMGLVPGLVDVLELGGRGASRAERVSEWLIDRDEVVDLHVADDDLASVLDKFW